MDFSFYSKAATVRMINHYVRFASLHVFSQLQA